MAKAASEETITCYRHSSRETGVSCSNCGRPICTDCMTSTSVGMRCPECAKQKTKVRTAATLVGTPQLTYALIVINIIAFVATSAASGGISLTTGTLYEPGSVYARAVADGEVWRIVTAGFLHAGLLHIALNMYFLYYLGTMMEPSIGKVRFGLLYLVSLVGGSFGALLLSPDAATVGASGAVFGLMGAAILFMRSRGIGLMESGLGITLALNIVISFRPGISFGGHLGGLAAGLVVGYLMFELAERRRIPTRVVYGITVGIAIALAIGGVVTAESWVSQQQQQLLF